MPRRLPGVTQDRVLLVIARILVAAAAVAPFWFWKGGLLELEVLHFIGRYLDERSMLRKVFDPYTNDFRTYQARELSYFIDYIDAHVFQHLLRWDVAVFIPLSAVAATALTIGIFFHAIRRYWGLTPLTASLLLLVYMSNYIHLVTMGMYYRSTKPLLAPILMGTVFYLAAIFEGRARRWTPLAVFGLFCLMGLLDRQGFLYSVVGAGLVITHAVIKRAHWPLAGAAVSAVLLLLAYNYRIGPWLIERISGYVPSLAYQEVNWPPLETATPYRQAIEILGEAVRILLGSVATALGVAVALAVAAAGVWRSNRPTRFTLTAILVTIALSQIAMFAMMVVRHPAIYEWIDHRYWYYPLPFQALVLALLAMLLHRAIQGWRGWKLTVVNVALAMMVVGNVAHWTYYRDVQLTSRWFSRVYPQTSLLRSSLAARQPDPRLSFQYRLFYDRCMQIKAGQ